MADLPIKRHAAPLRHQVLEALRGAIVAGQLLPGQRLIERELIEMTGVSRTVVREALRQLEVEGLVEIIPHKGPVVRELTPAEAKDLYRIRGVLEGLAARLFAEQGDPEALQALDDALARVRRAYTGDDGESALDAKTNFYEKLYAGAASETLATLLAMIQARIWRWRAVGLTHPMRADDRRNESIENLTRLVDAIRSGSGNEAEHISRQEVKRAATEVLRLIAAETETAE